MSHYLHYIGNCGLKFYFAIISSIQHYIATYPNCVITQSLRSWYRPMHLQQNEEIRLNELCYMSYSIYAKAVYFKVQVNCMPWHFQIWNWLSQNQKTLSAAKALYALHVGSMSSLTPPSCYQYFASRSMGYQA